MHVRPVTAVSRDDRIDEGTQKAAQPSYHRRRQRRARANAYRVRQFQLNTFIGFFVSSSFVHFRKPDADIYRMALDIAQASPKQVLYIDDRSLFVEVAEGLGIRGIVHKEYNATQKAMEAFGLSLTR
ncbi:MAG: HAD hydrolase-like protein [Anaerolineales bacterium]|nr:HAD hydrolase-like protein [Anaerolineales bacterium]